jgi:hypothetical protein
MAVNQEQEYYEEERDNPEEEFEEELPPAPEGRKDSARRFTQIQIFACAAVLLVAVALRTFGGSFYQTARNWYLTAVGDSVLPEEQVENIQHTVINLWSSVSNLRPSGFTVSSQPDSAGSQAQTPSDASGANPSSAAASSGNAGSSGGAPNSAAP